MDTRYWGPSGWRLLHLISFAGRGGARWQRQFFESLPYVLPCKYCRASLGTYMRELPFSSGAGAGAGTAKWLWAIHNKVNAKLRGQKLHVEPDPPFSAVRRVYEDRLRAGCTRTAFEGWEFLFSVVENHPYSKQSLAGAPMPDAPPPEECKRGSDLDKNCWNVLEPAARLGYVAAFWEALPHVLPFPEWEAAWTSCGGADWSSRASSLRSLWQIRCTMERELGLLNKTTFYSLCSALRSHRSGCSASKRGKTCRRRR
jgi:Erv1 / Alr family